MFISDKIVFVELHKTGCTYIRNVLDQLVDGSLLGIHNQVNTDLLTSPRNIWGSVRNPWDWYVSLWAYGCDGKGGVYQRSIKPAELKIKGLGWTKNPYAAVLRVLDAYFQTTQTQWKRLYEDVNDAEAFREWLYRVHDPRFNDFLREGYDRSQMRDFAGFLTYRYVKLFCCKKEDMKILYSLATFDEVKEFNEERCFVDKFILNESLNSDLLEALASIGISVDEQQKSAILTSPKTNASSRKKGIDYYYDRDTGQLILDRERLLIEKFHYEDNKPSCLQPSP